MAKTIKDTFLASLGVMHLTREKAEQLSKKLIKKGALLKEKQEVFIKVLMEKSKESKEEIEKKLKQTASDLIARGDIVEKKARKGKDELEKKLKETVGRTVADLKVKGKQLQEKQDKAVQGLKDTLKKKIGTDDARIEARIDEKIQEVKASTESDLAKMKKEISELKKILKNK